MVLIRAVMVLVLVAMVAQADYPSAPPAIRAAYWLDKPTSDPTHINATDFTHLFCSCATLNATTSTALPPVDTTLLAFTSAARVSNPTIKLLLSIGGDSSAFSAMASSPTSRSTFINSSIALARSLSYNGLDLDWEFPQSDTDMANMASLFHEFRSAAMALTNNNSSPFLLTAVVWYNVTVFSRGSIAAPTCYPVASIAKNLDWINIKAMDYHGSWEVPIKTGEHTSLFDPTPESHGATDYGVRQWIMAGLPASQAVLGLAMYGRTWYLQDPTQNGVGAPALRAGPNDGVYTYDEINAFVNSSKGAYCRNDAVAKAAFCYGKQQLARAAAGSSNLVLWAGFDNPRSIATKVRYLKAKKLRGYIFWALGSDTNGDLSKTASLTLL